MRINCTHHCFPNYSPEVGEELKRVARERASISNKGHKKSDAGSSDSSEKQDDEPQPQPEPAKNSLVSSKESDSKLEPPPTRQGEGGENNESGVLPPSIEDEIDHIVAAISNKLRNISKEKRDEVT